MWVPYARVERMKHRFFAIAAAFALATISPASAQSHFSVGYQVDAAHGGTLRFGTGFKPPLTLKWTRDLGLNVSYPIVVRGLVYVTTGCPDGGPYSGQVVALDLATGETVWHKDYDVTYCWLNSTYDAGHLFVLGFDGVLRKFSRAGDLLWTVQFADTYGPVSAATLPTASDGQVFATLTVGLILGVSERSGNINWAGAVPGDEGFPVVGDGGVYVTVPYHTQRFDLATGSQVWHYTCGGYGGGGWPTAYPLGPVFSPDNFCNSPLPTA